jgi:HEPN domain-containing protein
MKTLDDADVAAWLAEADEDLVDAATLARRPGGSSMAQYHSAQAAEKFLRGLCEAMAVKANPMWDLARVYQEIRKCEGLSEVAAAVEALAAHGTPGKGNPAQGSSGDALRAIRAIRRAVLVALGMDLPAEPPFVAGAVAAATGPMTSAAPTPAEAALENGPPAGYVNAPPPGYDDGPTFPHGDPAPATTPQFRGPSGRDDGDRRSSYVKMFLICDTCGVRLPRTRQTAMGRVPCPHCNRPMRLAS